MVSLKEAIVFKLTNEGFFIVFDEMIKFEVLKELLKQKLDESEDFFLGVKLKAIIRGRIFEEKELEEIKQIITEKTGFDDIIEELPKFDWQNNLVEGNTKFYKGTMRCGASIEFNGNVVVMGDINPGAEVIATGNIVVTGTIKGLVHAGANGNNTAIVYGKGIHPTQLRIGNLITVTPEETKKSDDVFEIAYVRGGNIYISED